MHPIDLNAAIRSLGSFPVVRDSLARPSDDATHAWAARLPELLAEVTEDFGLYLGSPLTGGARSVVFQAELSDGSPVVAKLAYPDAATAAGFAAMTLAGADAAADVYSCDPQRGLLLTERLTRHLSDLDLSDADRISIVLRSLEALWRPVPEESPLLTAEGYLQENAASALSWWETAGRPCPRRLVEMAQDMADHLPGAVDSGDVLLMGDPHGGNLLERQGHGAAPAWRWIDLSGLRGPRAFDLASMLLFWPMETPAGARPELVLRDGCVFLGDACGVAAEDIWRWTVPLFVSRALVLMTLGDPISRLGAALLEASLNLDEVMPPVTAKAPHSSPQVPHEPPAPRPTQRWPLLTSAKEPAAGALRRQGGDAPDGRRAGRRSS